MKTRCILWSFHRFNYMWCCFLSPANTMEVLLFWSWMLFKAQDTDKQFCSFYHQQTDLNVVFFKIRRQLAAVYSQVFGQINILVIKLSYIMQFFHFSQPLWPHMATAWLCTLTDLDTLQNERTWWRQWGWNHVSEVGLTQTAIGRALSVDIWIPPGWTGASNAFQMEMTWQRCCNPHWAEFSSGKDGFISCIVPILWKHYIKCRYQAAVLIHSIPDNVLIVYSSGRIM